MRFALLLLVVAQSAYGLDYLHAGSTTLVSRDLVGLQLDGASLTDHCVDWRNDDVVTSSGSFLEVRSVKTLGCPAGKAGLHLLGIKPPGGEGNVYGALVLHSRFDAGLGHGIWLDSQSSSGAAGTAVSNIWASSASGNQGYGLLLDTSNAPASAHGLTNVFGTVLQGNSQAAVRAASVSNFNLLGSYFEQTAGQPQLSGRDAPFPQGPWLLAGNSVGNSSAHPEYNFDLGGDSGYGVIGLVSQANLFSPAERSNYNITRLVGAMIGPDRAPAGGQAYVDWERSWAWRMVQVYDVAANTMSLSSDRRYSDQPRVGFGVPVPQVAAQVHIGGERVVQNPSDLAAIPALRVDGIADLTHLRLKSPDGSLWRLMVGDDGGLSVQKVPAACP